MISSLVLLIVATYPSVGGQGEIKRASFKKGKTHGSRHQHIRGKR